MPKAKQPYVTNIRANGQQLAGEQLVVDHKPGCEANSLVLTAISANLTYDNWLFQAKFP